MLSIIERIIKWMGIYKKRMYAGFIYAFCEALTHSLPIVVAFVSLKMIVEDKNGVRVLSMGDIMVLTAVMVVLVLLRWVFSYLRAVKQESIAYEVTADERIRIGDILKRVPMGFFKQKRTGELSTAVTTDLSFYELHGISMINVVVNAYLPLMISILFFLYLSKILTLISLAGVAVSSVGLYYLGRRSRENALPRHRAVDNMASETLEFIRGISVVKSNSHHANPWAGIRAAYDEARKINIKIETEYSVFDCLSRVGLYAATTGMMMAAALLAVQGELQLPVMIMLLLFSFFMFSGVESVSGAVHVLQVLDSTLDKLEGIKGARFIDEDGKALALSNHDIEFDHVSFSYDDQAVLKDVSFKIPEKTTTAIVGSSGSGKTTITNLIARFYDVNEGRILMGGQNLKAFTCDSLLSNISMVFQNVYLFNDTIMNNIRFGSPGANEADVIWAAKKACCHDFITALPQGYNTMAGEGGAMLSGGEKQRISIARAILKNAPIVILDEATASIDPENERLIQAALAELTRGKTTIIIAHRLSTIEHADQILVVEDGRIIQQGRHQVLAGQDGVYSKFVNIRRKAEGWSLGN